MSKQARDELLHSFKYADKVIDKTIIESMDRELDLYEIAQMTRAGTAKCLGISNMYGGLTPGMNANVAIYDLNPEDMPKDPEMIENAFSRAAYMVKDGVVVVENGDVIATTPRKTIWTDAKYPLNELVERDIREKFLKYYTVELENYMVFDDHVYNTVPLEVESPAA